VDSYFGGRAEDEQIDDEGVEQRREITAAELRITRIVIDRIARDLEAAWAPVFKIAIEHSGVETNPLFASIASPPERVIAARFGIRFGSLQDELSFVIPYSMVEPIKAILDNGLLTGQDVDLRWRDKLIENLLNVTLEIRGTLAETTVPVRRILTMKSGDVIPINLPKQLPVDLEGTPAYRGALGSARGRNAVKITQVLRKDSEFAPSAGTASTGLGARAVSDTPAAGPTGRKQRSGIAAYA
jgi:flagellar motor switch protein FliM